MSAILMLFCRVAIAATHYVSLTSTNPISPFLDHSTAATNIQAAINSATPGDLVLVDSGTYTNDTTVIYGAETNRVALTNGITLMSLNGPGNTLIVGNVQTRCAYVGSNSILSGFTITNGQASLSGDSIKEQSGGGIWCEMGGMVSNCVVISNYAGNMANLQTNHWGGGIYGGTISNCVIAGNLAGSGGGIAAGVLYQCTVSNNFAAQGGGIYSCMNYSSTISSNRATSSGGGSYQGTNFNCLITKNSAGGGGGSQNSICYNCSLTFNNATGGSGGGSGGGTLYNCLVYANSSFNLDNPSPYISGGVGGAGSTLYWCTVVSNRSDSGPGGFAGMAYYSIIYYNEPDTPPNGGNAYGDSSYAYCCITSEPGFVNWQGGDFRLRSDSPCIDLMTNSWFYFLIGTNNIPTNDIRGLPRLVDGDNDGIARYDIGAYEYNPAVDQVPLIYNSFSFTNFSTGYPVPFGAGIGRVADYYWWDFGDGVIISNQNNVSHAWTSPGNYSVKLSAYYSSSGITLTATSAVLVVPQSIFYVDTSNTPPIAPFTNWQTAAHDIQSAIACATVPGSLVLVNDGTYSAHGVIVSGNEYNAIAVTNSIIVASVNGSGLTSIIASGGRCAYLGPNSYLNGFSLSSGTTLTNGNILADLCGGGIWADPSAIVSNCVVSSCTAAQFGGGVYQGNYFNCVVTKNLATGNSTIPRRGGGAYYAKMYNSTISSNSLPDAGYNITFGAGAHGGILSNCVIKYNTNSSGIGGGAHLGSFYNCSIYGNYGINGGGGTSTNYVWNSKFWGNSSFYAAASQGAVMNNCLVVSNLGNQILLGCWMTNCTVAGNVSSNYAAVNPAAAYNCVIYDNYDKFLRPTNNVTVPQYSSSFVRNNCIFPQVWSSAQGNFTNDPRFINWTNGDFHLSSNSPCINAGLNSVPAGAVDFDQNPRIAGGTIDVGAYEFQNPTSVLSYAWAQQYGFPADGSADYLDADGDGMNNWQEWKAGTNPTNAASVFKFSSISNGVSGITVSWLSNTNTTYYVQRSASPAVSTAFSSIASNLVGAVTVTSYQDPTATNAGPYYYRVGVQ